MPTLPTLTINNADAWNRLLAAFNSDPVAYKTWLRSALASYVLDFEVNQQVESRRTELTGVMDGAS